MPSYDNIYITVDKLLEAKDKVVESVKTAYNYSVLMNQYDVSAIEIPPINGEEIDPILLPLFREERVKQYSYEKVDVYSGAPNNEPSATSAYPEPSIMSAYNEKGHELTLSGISTQECMIVATINGIVKQLIADNKLLYNNNTSQKFKWYVQKVEPKLITFDKNNDYGYWYEDSQYTINQSISSGGFLTDTTLVKEDVAREVSASYNGNFIQLSRYVKVDIDTNNVDVDNLTSVNVLAKNSVDEKRYNCDYYISGNSIWVQLKNDYNASLQTVTFNIVIQYFFE